jgi:hypothetical protein
MTTTMTQNQLDAYCNYPFLMAMGATYPDTHGVEEFELKTYTDGTKNYTVEQFTHQRIDKQMYDSSVNQPLERYVVDGKTYYTVWSVVRPRNSDITPHREIYYHQSNNVLTSVYQITVAHDGDPRYTNIDDRVHETAIFYNFSI